MAKEYIEIYALIDAIKSTDWYHLSVQRNMVHGAVYGDNAWYKAEDIYKVLKEAPAADVVERKHGEWIGVPITKGIGVCPYFNGNVGDNRHNCVGAPFSCPCKRSSIWGKSIYHCSECGFEVGYSEKTKTNFCPNCGTKMDGGGRRDIGQEKTMNKMTKADTIRDMTDEQLAKRLQKLYCPPGEIEIDCCSVDCTACWLRWLQQPIDAIALENLCTNSGIELEENEKEYPSSRNSSGA